ncbi:MAG TPA: alpha/beta fold hydrolase [Gammaproteobacteria bacterium]|nr:alpha/beta fold hydrolase [Gammaproteobacteria bacterium]
MNMNVLKISALLLALSTLPSIVLAAGAPDCHVGTYKLADGSLVDIDPVDDDGTHGWISADGRMGTLHPSTGDTWTSTLGWTKQEDGISVSFPDCGAGVIDFAGISGQRIAFDVQDVSFTSHGTALVGRLTMPKGVDKAPVVVLVHGSEPSSALSSPGVVSALQRLLPAEGVGVFAFDKRGTGKSGGKYTQDYDILADDVTAATTQARQSAGMRLGRIGFWGGSQGGWVAPLAANRTPVDFVIVCYGLAVNVIDEDQESIALQMREKGYPPETIAKGLEVGHAAETLFIDDFKDGYKEFDAMRVKYGKAPWYKDVRGDFSWLILPHTDKELRAMAKDFDWHTPFYYDAMPTLRSGKTPQLWILGGEDYSAPSEETGMRIKSLIADGKPFTLALYPRAEHGMRLFDTEPDGTRDTTRYVPGYFDMIRDFARDGRLTGSYGDAQISAPHPGP